MTTPAGQATIPATQPVQPVQIQTSLEPPDMSILKDRAQLEFYITALENWADLQDCGGYPAERRAAVIFSYAFRQNPALCKQLTDHFKKSLKDDPQGVQKIIDWLKEKYGLTKHADIVRVLNNWFNITRAKQESLLDYITRFEAAYSEVESLGETISPTTRSILLLRQAELSNTDHQIITVNLDLDPKAKDAENQFDQTKEAMRKFQHTQMANSVRIAGNTTQTKTYLGEFIEQLEQDNTVEDSVKANIQAFLAQQKATRGGGRGGQYPIKVRLWKCDFCICDHKKWIDCGCLCTKHTRDKCPNPDKAKVDEFKKRKKKVDSGEDKRTKMSETAGAGPGAATERGFYGYMRKLDEVFGEDNAELTLVAKIVNVTESETPQPLDKLMNILGITSSPAEHLYGRETCSQARHSSVERNSKGKTSDVKRGQEKIFVQQSENQQRETEATMELLLDTGSPSTIIGVKEFKKIKEVYLPMIQNTLRYQESSRVYEFGGGEVTPSLGRVKLPMYVVDVEEEIQVLWIWIEILQQENVPFLLGGRSMKKTKSVINFDLMTITLDWEGKKIELKLQEHESGHFKIPFFPLSRQDDKIKTRQLVESEDWNANYSNTVLNYLLLEKKNDITALIINTEKQLERVLISKHKKGDRKPLTEEEIIKLHHTFGHVHPDKLKQIVIKASKHNQKTLAAIEKLRECEICQVENSRIPRPRVSLPRSSAFGHVLAMDLFVYTLQDIS